MRSTRRFAVITAVTLAGISSLSACGRWYQRSDQSATAPCSGQRYLEVRNNFESPLELCGYPPDGGNARFLATVSPGTQRVRLVAPVGAVYAEVGGRRISQGGAKNGDAGGMSVTRGCEAATN